MYISSIGPERAFGCAEKDGGFFEREKTSDLGISGSNWEIV
jgi:hypothetical protein